MAAKDTRFSISELPTRFNAINIGEMKHLSAIALGLFVAYAAFAHPHAYVDTMLDFSVDQDGLSSIEERWTLSEN